MNKWGLALIPFVAAFTGVGFWAGGGRSASSNQVESPPVRPEARVVNPADAVRDIFRVKCAGCHGPDLPRPRGRFGYVLDLNRLAADREKIVPGRPAESELWALVEHDEMPPPDAPRGRLTPSEKETVRAWIEAGAPDSVK
jgi:mono/diheme cytochrome c family protein